MSWVVDSCVLLDIALRDPKYARPAAATLTRLMKDGLVACPVSLIEISPALLGRPGLVNQFCAGLGVRTDEDWTIADTEAGIRAWNAYVSAKRAGLTGKRPIADLIVGAFASQRSGLITRKAGDFKPWFGKTKIVDPTG